MAWTARAGAKRCPPKSTHTHYRRYKPYLFPCPRAAAGLAPTKAKHLVGLSAALEARHGGTVPATLPDLVCLPGVGPKTAAVVLSQVCQSAGWARRALALCTKTNKQTNKTNKRPLLLPPRPHSFSVN